MNIFILDDDPVQAAKYHNDKHCVKMIVETAQLLSTTHHFYDSDIADKVYRKTHVNHPSTIWVRESRSNYEWTYRLFTALCDEYTNRYGKVHKTMLEKGPYLSNPPDGIPEVGLTNFPQCMPDDCMVLDDPVTAYRNYYKQYKAHIAKWKLGQPDWW